MPPAPRTSTRKPHGLRLGRRVTSIKVGPDSLPFAIHEDVLCKNSTFFRNLLRPNQKPVEGECSICHDELKEDTDELTHCSACGGNIHYTCLEVWKSGLLPEAVTCPLCRHAWSEPAPSMYNLDAFNVKAFELYTEWLYYRKIYLEGYQRGCSGTMDKFECLLEAYLLGTKIDDQAFCYATLRSIIAMFIESPVYFGHCFVVKAYTKTSSPCSLRTLLVGLYMNVTSRDIYLEAYWATLPIEFRSDLGLALLRDRPSTPRRWTVEEIASKYLPQPPSDASCADESTDT